LNITEAPGCIFCGSSPTEVEDVFPKWVKKLLPRQKGITAVAADPITGVVTYYPGIAYDARAKVVCKPCNNRWMSDIEHRASRYMKPMVFGFLSVPLSSTAQTQLATWALLKSFLIPYVLPDSQYVPQTHYAEFQHLKKPWWQHAILLGRYNGILPSGAHTYLFDVTGKDANGLTVRGELYGITLHVHKLVVQTVGHSMPGSIQPKFPSEFAPFVVRVWPNELRDIAWPPQTIDDEILEAYRRSFDRIVS
jgi:hypothetical protein